MEENESQTADGRAGAPLNAQAGSGIHDHDFEAFLADVDIHGLAEFFQRKPVGDEALDREADSLGAAQEVVGDRVFVHRINPRADERDFLRADILLMGAPENAAACQGIGPGIIENCGEKAPGSLQLITAF